MTRRVLRKRTKIVATVGPATAARGTLERLFRAGVDVTRVNFSHGSAEHNLDLIDRIRSVASRMDASVAIIQDLQGPRLRVGQLPPGGQALLEGNVVTLRCGTTSAEDGVIPVPEGRLASDVKRGDVVLFDGGELEIRVLKVEGRRIFGKVVLGGVLHAYKGMTVPSTALSLEALTEKDILDLSMGLEHRVDFVALSFVRTAPDLQHARRVIARRLPRDVDPPGVIAKIEKHEALENFDEILEEADGVMIARGDLGLETPASSVPVRQKELVAKCVVAGKPVIVATQMLSSMQHRPRPTRAEVSDVANAVIDHADALMLSEETALGRYPIQATEVMARTIRDVEESSLDNLLPHHETTGESVSFAVGAAAVELARRVDAVALLVTTHSGYSARAVARFRPEVPLFAATDSPLVQRQLGLSWGVTSLYVEGYAEPDRMVRRALKRLTGHYKVGSGPVVVVSGLRRKRGAYDSTLRVVEA